MAFDSAQSAFAGLAQAANSASPGGSSSTKVDSASWRAALKPASFRGVPFKVASRDLETGRRAVTHEFPGRDMPYTEDMGRKARTFTVEGYVLGANYMAARDALLAACEAEGHGALIVPWTPEVRVECTGCRLRESQAEGGMATFSLTFAEGGQAAAPTGTPMPGVLNGGKADDAFSAVGQVLNSSVKIGGVPFPVQADTLAAIKGLGKQISGVSSLVRMGANIPGNLAKLANLGPADFVGLLPSELCGPLFGLAGAYSLFSSAFAPAHAARTSALLTLAQAAPVVTVPYGAGLVRTTMAENRAALSDYQRNAAVAEAARSAVYSAPASRQEAILLRDQVTEAIDTVLESTRDEATFTAFTTLRTTTVRALAEAAGSAPDVVTVRSTAVLPSLVLAQRLNPDTDAPDEEGRILTRNKVRHPGFVPPGALEVLRA